MLKTPHRNPLVEIYEARQEPKTEKKMFKVKFTHKGCYKMAAWRSPQVSLRKFQWHLPVDSTPSWKRKT